MKGSHSFQVTQEVSASLGREPRSGSESGGAEMPGLPKRLVSGWEGLSIKKQKARRRGIRIKEEGAHFGFPVPTSLLA